MKKLFLPLVAAIIAVSLSLGAFEGEAQADHGTCAPDVTLPDLTGLSGAEGMAVMNAWNRAVTAEAHSGVAKYTFEAGICSWDEMRERAYVVGKALAILKLLSEPANITVNASAYPCSGATTGNKVTGYTAGHVDAGGLFLGWPTWDADWFYAGEVKPNTHCPLEGRIADVKLAVETTYFNVTGVKIVFDEFQIDFEPAWPDNLYLED